MDHVDRILAQWRTERPDLDVAPMGLIVRIKRLMAHLSREMGETWTEHGLNTASFDVLATLRRSGAPFEGWHFLDATTANVHKAIGHVQNMMYLLGIQSSNTG